MRLVVGRIGRAHGLRGEVLLEVRTDDPEIRFGVGATVETDSAGRGPLVVEALRWQSGRLVVRFAGFADRTGAAALTGLLLVADSSTSPPLDDPEEFWDHDLLGLAAVDAAGARLGEVVDVLHPGGGDLLVVRRGEEELLVPFVPSIVPVVDLAGKRIVVEPPDGLFEL